MKNTSCVMKSRKWNVSEIISEVEEYNLSGLSPAAPLGLSGCTTQKSSSRCPAQSHTGLHLHSSPVPPRNKSTQSLGLHASLFLLGCLGKTSSKVSPLPLYISLHSCYRCLARPRERGVSITILRVEKKSAS